MATFHSYVKLTGADGKTLRFTFPQVLYLNIGQLKDQVILLSDWIEDLEGKRDAILKQAEEVKGLWDAQHVAPLVTAMGDCAELLDEAIQDYEIAYKNLVLLISANQGVQDFLAQNPEYNNTWKNHRNHNTYVFHKHIEHAIGPTTYKNATLEFHV